MGHREARDDATSVNITMMMWMLVMMMMMMMVHQSGTISAHLPQQICAQTPARQGLGAGG